MKVKKLKDNKFLQCIIVIICIGILIVCSFIQANIAKLKNTKEQKAKNNIIVFENNTEKLEKSFENRYVLVNKTNLLIGKSKKELENNYFDIKIENTGVLTINKLVYEDILKSNELINTKYLNDLTSFLNDTLKLDFSPDSLNMLNDLVSEKFTNLRSVDNVDNITDKIKDETIVINKHEIYFTIENNMLILTFSEV